jgi:RNA polymerase sigma-70 factor (ECF subfamily)
VRRPRRPVDDRVSPAGRAASDLDGAVAAACAGDESAFTVVYRALTPGLLRFVRTIVGEAAEDVVAEMWLQATRDLAKFTGDGDAFRAWTATIARNRALDHLRRVQSRPETVALAEGVELAAADDVPAAALERMSTARAVELIAELPKDQAEAVLLRVIVGLDAESAGRVLGKRAGAVRTCAQRGLTRLARELTVPGGDAVPAGVTEIESAALKAMR